MLIADVAGWLAAALTLATFSMRTMVWLRALAICSNFAFISYGYLAEQHPILLLHSILLPFNSLRFYEALKARHYARLAELGAFDVRWIQDVAQAKTFRKGATILSKGDAPHHAFYIVSGKVLVVEADVILRDSEIFGEIAFLTQQGKRTSDVRALADTTALVIGREAFQDLLRTNPEFGAFICRLVAERLTPAVGPRAEQRDRKRRRQRRSRAA